MSSSKHPIPVRPAATTKKRNARGPKTSAAEPSGLIERSSSASPDTLTSPPHGAGAAAGPSNCPKSKEEFRRRQQVRTQGRLDLHVNELWNQGIQQEREREGADDTQRGSGAGTGSTQSGPMDSGAGTSQSLATLERTQEPKKEQARLTELKDRATRNRKKEKGCERHIEETLRKVEDPAKRSKIFQKKLRDIQRWSDDETGAEPWRKKAIISLYQKAIKGQEAEIAASEKDSKKEMQRKKRAAGTAENPASQRRELEGPSINAGHDRQRHPQASAAAATNQTLLPPVNFGTNFASGQSEWHHGAGERIASQPLSVQRIQSSPGMFGQGEHGLAGGSPRPTSLIQRNQSSAVIIGRTDHGHAGAGPGSVPRHLPEQSDFSNVAGDRADGMSLPVIGHLIRPYSVLEYRYKHAAARGWGGRGPPPSRQGEDRTVTTGHPVTTEQLPGDITSVTSAAGTVTTWPSEFGRGRGHAHGTSREGRIGIRSTSHGGIGGAARQSDSGIAGAGARAGRSRRQTPSTYRVPPSAPVSGQGGRGRLAEQHASQPPEAPRMPGHTVVTGQGHRNIRAADQAVEAPERPEIPDRITITGQGHGNDGAASGGGGPSAADAGIAHLASPFRRNPGQQYSENDTDWIKFCKMLAQSPRDRSGVI
jgi:hypothetical protein